LWIGRIKPPFTFFQEQVEMLPWHPIELSSMPLRLVPEIFDPVDVFVLLHKTPRMIDAIVFEF
jgi:hypothetical protein